MIDPTSEVARRYLYGGLGWGTAAQIWLLGWLGWLFFSGAAWRWAQRLPGWRFAGACLASVALVLAPFDFYLGYQRESAYGFQRQSAAAWWLDWLKSSLVSWLVAMIATGLAYWILRRGSRRWWIQLWALVVVLAVVAVAIEPVLIAPLFNTFTEVHDPVERARVLALAHRAGVPVDHVYEVDASRQSGHTNAYVVGLFGSQRIVLYDTLLRQQTPAEIDFVVGHEIGHYVLHHLWKGLAFTAALLFAVFALTAWGFRRWAPRGGVHEAGDIAGLPLLLLLLAGLLWLAAPLSNGFSRWEEHQADAYGLALTGDGCAALSSFEREIGTDLIDPNPPRWVVLWFFNHPAQRDRMEFVQRACH